MPDGFAEIAEQHLDDVYAYLVYLTGDRAAAEDLAAETFEKALRSWKSFDARRGSAKTWLCQIARSRALDHFRSEQRRRRREDLYAVREPVEHEEVFGRGLPLRRLALVAVPTAVVLAAAGALVGGFATSGGGKKQVISVTRGPAFGAKAAPAPSRSAPGASVHKAAGAGATIAPSGGRAQLYTADITLRVKNLSAATKSALATTRSLGGYVR